eukprot:CAMPEP_0194303604 /NCGR_PEP_ID=MMETSP0171-20130528/1447_1 /TAXON_ID=218684 /ORGANISM="Corethron pennatum, Strain L29A3" /LENGTH=357 /DNA_ID=CAMNT_0039054563 /DNA_START=71 /DNA_END=1144 /DNA_ORIENTATION=-
MKFSFAVTILLIIGCTHGKEAKRRLKAKKESKQSAESSAGPTIPTIPGVKAGNVILSQYIDYPPYAMLGEAEDDFPLSGFGAEVARGLEEVCDISITVAQTDWGNCWTSEDKIGIGLARGEFHGCMTYTHTAGVRNRFLDFSAPILSANKAAGIITRLKDGVPVISGSSDLSGVKVADVLGWAPTADNLAIVTNTCTGEKFSGYEIVKPKEVTGNENQDALLSLLNGDADALWIYADQAYNYGCANKSDSDTHDCTLWDGLGTEFAYIHSGMFDFVRAGTTLAMSKKGSGLPEVLDPCIESFLKTESYYELCEKYEQTKGCFPNEFFPAGADSEKTEYNTPPNELPSGCIGGYCGCS